MQDNGPPIPDVASTSHDMLLTVAVAIAAGVMLIVIARRLNLPAIVLLLAGGVLLGPEVMGWVEPETLGRGLAVIVSLSVGIILFEGGLTLEMDGYRSAPTMIKRLLTIGVLVTWLLTAAAIRLLFGGEIEYALLAASLVIVTGPTVIAPLLKRIKIAPRLHSILHWEGVLIDPIGVFIALLCFEYVVSDATGAGALTNLGVRVAAGLGFGLAGGLFIAFVVRREIIPTDLVNVFALGCAVLVFGLAEYMQSEAGLLSVTVAGFVFGLSGSYRVKQVRRFKGELTDLLIGTLFILLSARLTFDQFLTFGFTGLVVVAIVIFLVRPISILICSIGLDLTGREKVFLGWVAPRGIVAASIASLFAISIAESRPSADAEFVETFVYSVIIATIVLHGSTAGPLARLLRLKRKDPTGWMLVGSHVLARRLAAFIVETSKLPVVLVDTNVRALQQAKNEGLRAIETDARDVSFQDKESFQGIGNVLAFTDNEDLNIRICQNWTEVVGPDHVFRCNPSGIEPAGHADEEQPTGRVIWPRLPRPSLLSGEIVRGETTILRGAGNEPALRRVATSLVTVAGGKIVFDSDSRGDGEEPPDGPTLFLQRSADYLRRAVRPELIATVDAGDIEALFGRLVDLAVDLNPQLPRDAIIRDLLDREAGLPSALGHGVAVPHAYVAPLTTRVCVLARVPGGIDFKAHDDEPVRLVFLLLSPSGDPEGHLATLAEIARLVIEPTMRTRLVEARSPLDVVEIIAKVAR